ncbi:MAG: ATP-binding protein [Gammaproteobacteria bacterium]|nr:ATP-binding protein [Gammaproteobacteria bacterium]MYJ51828.1 ATP-binding protein [Gammaproteobacteria bacterium]
MIKYERIQLSALLARLRETPRRLIVVTGPRQTGKTTLVRQALGQIKLPSQYLPVDRPDPTTLPLVPDTTGDITGFVSRPRIPSDRSRDTEWLVRQWDTARENARNSGVGFVLALDEIQKIAGWSETVKGLWDEDRLNDLPLHVILLSSAPLLMQQGMTESLAGRFETVRLTHWSFTEMAEAFGFDLEHYIYFGGYPGGASYVGEQDRWRSYIVEALIEPNIEKDILAMQRVDKPALFKQLFQLSAEYSGQILSYNKMIGQLQDAGNTTTLARYLELLERAGLIVGLQKYSAKPHLRKSSIPKLNVLNTALMTAEAEYGFREAMADRSYWGRLVESAVGAHLFNTGISRCRLHYWREKEYEVDFVLSRGPKVIAFEVKSGVHRPRVRGLGRFAEQFDVRQSVLVSDEGDISLSEFLSKPADEWFD